MNDVFQEACTRLDESLADANDFLHGLQLGVEATIPLNHTTDLEFGKALDGEKRRCLYVVSNGSHAKQLSSQSLEIKMKAAGLIPAMIEALRMTRANRGGEIQATADKLFLYLGALEDE